MDEARLTWVMSKRKMVLWGWYMEKNHITEKKKKTFEYFSGT
jgi:hypothetical protein